jgi:hypothetical protein
MVARKRSGRRGKSSADWQRQRQDTRWTAAVCVIKESALGMYFMCVQPWYSRGVFIAHVRGSLLEPTVTVLTPEYLCCSRSRGDMLY